jgi:hypothetical protein
MLIYSDETMEVFHRPGSSSYLLVTFNERDLRANGSRFWGQRFCEKADIAALVSSVAGRTGFRRCAG